MKRLFDFTISLCLLVLTLPLFILIMILTLCTSGTPFFFTQTRIGRHQKPFQLIKFRTMTNKQDENGNLLLEQHRLTKVGKFLRKLNLDELPLFLNVIKGDLSLVGPHPLLARYLPYLTKQELKRFSIRPGITGLAQISGGDQLSWDKRLKLDIQYVNDQSFGLDIKILLKTLVQVFKRKTVINTPLEIRQGLDEERRALTIDPSSFIQIRPLKITDSERVMLMIERGLPSSIFQCTIYSCIGYKSYLEALLSISPLSPEQTMVHFIGAYKQDELVGFSEWRIGECNLHLNNLYVKPSMRGSGVGKKLIQEGLNLAQKLHLSSITLDVFEYNQSALSWFKRLGFIYGKTTYWYVGTNPAPFPETDVSYTIINHPASKASHRIYDFSTLEIKTSRQTYHVSRLNKTYFKIHDPSALDDHFLLQALYSIDPVRSLLMVLPTPLGEKFSYLKMLDKSVRMTLHLRNE
ncbi:MAG: GNAT family N-acetyltransferase [Bacillus sp. (in: Bacteria)]|nr:GNAT family N-acetyltransferase [Bacillus sp. (in: firmicutes)]